MVGFKIFTSKLHIPNWYNDTKNGTQKPHNSAWKWVITLTVHVILWWQILFRSLIAFPLNGGLPNIHIPMAYTQFIQWHKKMTPKSHKSVEVSYNLTVHVILWWQILFSSLETVSIEW